MTQLSDSTRLHGSPEQTTYDEERLPFESLLPKDFADRLDRLREASGLTWSGFAKALDVDYKQMLRWRKGVEPSGGAMHSLFLFAGRLPGGLAILMGDGFPDDLFQGLTDAPRLEPHGESRAETPPVSPLPSAPAAHSHTSNEKGV